VVEATFARGEEWAGTAGLVMHLFTNVVRQTETTFNVIAELAGRNEDNVVMVGGHLDSVSAGPGINDNGSGSAAILEVAEQMKKVKPVNTVRFAWWGAEESGVARIGGRVLAYGTIPEREGPFPFYDLYYKEIALTAARSARVVDFPAAIAAAASGRIQLEPLVSRRVSLEELPDAMAPDDGSGLKTIVEL